MHGTTYEKQLRVQEVKKLLARHGFANINWVNELIQKQFDCCRDAAWEYLRIARTEILEHTKRSADEHVTDTLNSLDDIVANCEDTKLRLQALQARTKLLGLNATKTLNLVVQKPLFDTHLQQVLLEDSTIQEQIQVVDKLLQ